MFGTEKSPEELIRERAYDLWEQDGRPEGQSESYWDRARQEIAAGDRDAVIETEPAVSKPPI